MNRPPPAAYASNSSWARSRVVSVRPAAVSRPNRQVPKAISLTDSPVCPIRVVPNSASMADTTTGPYKCRPALLDRSGEQLAGLLDRGHELIDLRAGVVQVKRGSGGRGRAELVV